MRIHSCRAPPDPPRTLAAARRLSVLGHRRAQSRARPLARGRPVVADELGDPASPRKALVVGCIHGNECAGSAILDRLRRLGVAAGTDLWLVPDANPDGHVAGTRGNARGVDLNRNFPWRWRPLGGVYYSGAGPSSERETRIATSLIRRLRPKVTIWFHQHLNMVVLTSGNLALQRRFARLAGLRVGRLPTYSGTATGWSNAAFPGTHRIRGRASGRPPLSACDRAPCPRRARGFRQRVAG